MAKPTSLLPGWATDATYTNGPFVGSPTKDPSGIPVSIANEGFIPGAGNAMAAEHVNDWWNQAFDFFAWVFDGSTTADLDAHIVETNAAGEARIATVIHGGTASVSVALNAIENTGNLLTATFSNTQASGRAIQATASGAGGYAVRAFATGSAGAGLFEGDPASPLPALTASAGGASLRGALFLAPGVAPSAPFDGDVWKIPGIASTERGGLEWYDADGAEGGGGGGIQRAWSTTEGMGFGYAEIDNTGQENAGTITTRTSLTINVPADAPAGDYVIDYSCRVQLGAGAATTTRIEVVFDNNGAGFADTFEIDFAALAQGKPVSTFKRLTLGAGSHTFRIRWRTLSAPDIAEIADARIKALGAFES